MILHVLNVNIYTRMLNVSVTISTMDDKNRQYKFWKFRITTYIVQSNTYNQIFKDYCQRLSARDAFSNIGCTVSGCLLLVLPKRLADGVHAARGFKLFFKNVLFEIQHKKLLFILN